MCFSQMSTHGKARSNGRGLRSRIEQAQNIHRLGALSADGWHPASMLGVQQRWEFFQRTACIAYPVRNKCERICSKGLVLKTPKVFDDAKRQEALVQYWSRDFPQDFLKPVYTYCATVGWCCATVVPDRRYGARPVCVPPTTPGLMLRWNQVGDVQAKLSGDSMFGDAAAGTISTHGIISRIFGNLGGCVTTSAGAGASSVGGGERDPNANENAFDLRNVPPGFFFSVQHELVFISLTPWDPSLPGIRTPMDPIRKNIEFWEETRELWLTSFRERVHRPVFIAKTQAHGGTGKNDPLLDTDLVRMEMPECKEQSRMPSQFTLHAIREQRETAYAGFLANRWSKLRNYHDVDPRAVLPPSMGGRASFGSSARERRLNDGEAIQRTDNFPDLPDMSEISSHLNEVSCQSYGVPLSLGSRSSDSGQAKLWSSGGDDYAFRMYQQTCAQDSAALERAVKKLYIRCIGPNHAVAAGIRKIYDQEREAAKTAHAKHEPLEVDGDVRMSVACKDGDPYELPAGQRKLLTKEFEEEAAKDGKIHEEMLEQLRALDDQVEVILLGNIEMSDVQMAADGGFMKYENYRLFLAANSRIPLSMVEEQPQDPFRLKVAEKEASIDANARAKAKAKSGEGGGNKSGK